MLYLAVFLAGMIVCAILLLAMSNSLVSLRNVALNKFAQIDMQLRNRQRLIDRVTEHLEQANMIEQVESLASFQQVIKLSKLAEAMQQDKAHKPSSVQHIEEFTQVQQQLSKSIKQFCQELCENSNLASYDLFVYALKEMNDVNKAIAYATYNYNDAVQAYNTEASKHPNIACADMLDLKPLQLMHIINEADIDQVKVGVDASVNKHDKFIFPAAS